MLAFCFILVFISSLISMQGLQFELHKPASSAPLHHDWPLTAGPRQVEGTVHAHVYCTCPTQCVSFCFVSSRVCIRHQKDWDDPQLTLSEGAVQRLLKQWHLMSSISEKNPFSLPLDSGCLSSLLSSPPSSSSGSQLTVRTSAPDSAARGQTSTSKESTVLAFQVKETHSPPPGVNIALFIILAV